MMTSAILFRRGRASDKAAVHPNGERYLLVIHRVADEVSGGSQLAELSLGTVQLFLHAGEDNVLFSRCWRQTPRRAVGCIEWQPSPAGRQARIRFLISGISLPRTASGDPAIRANPPGTTSKHGASLKCKAAKRESLHEFQLTVASRGKQARGNSDGSLD